MYLRGQTQTTQHLSHSQIILCLPVIVAASQMRISKGQTVTDREERRDNRAMELPVTRHWDIHFKYTLQGPSVHSGLQQCVCVCVCGRNAIFKH